MEKKDYLNELGHRVSIARKDGWTKDGLTAWKSDELSEFGEAFKEATENASQIRFNLREVDVNKMWLRGKKLSLPKAREELLITEWELRKVISDRKLLDKTYFKFGDHIVHGSDYDTFYDLLLDLIR